MYKWITIDIPSSPHGSIYISSSHLQVLMTSFISVMHRPLSQKRSTTLYLPTQSLAFEWGSSIMILGELHCYKVSSRYCYLHAVLLEYKSMETIQALCLNFPFYCKNIFANQPHLKISVVNI